MKRTTVKQACMRIAVACLTALLTMQVFSATKSKTVEYPLTEMANTTVRLHLLNYRPEYNISSVNMYVNTFLGKQEEHEVKIDPKSGEGELSFQQYGTALAFVVMTRSSLGGVWLAPGVCTVLADVH